MNRFAKVAIKIGVSAVILLVLMIGGGIFYVWYSGQNSEPIVVKNITKAAKTTIVPKPAVVDENAKVGVSIQALTTPVKPGSNSSISVKTNPGASCAITVKYNKVASTDSGLKPKDSDEYGVVSWTWTVESSVPLGTWPVDVTCSRNNKSGFNSGDLVVSNTVEQE